MMKYRKCWQCGKTWLMLRQCDCPDNWEDCMVQIGSLTFNEKE